MPFKCAAFKCSTNYYPKLSSQEKIPVHSFPRDETRFRVWNKINDVDDFKEKLAKEVLPSGFETVVSCLLFIFIDCRFKIFFVQ